MLTWLKTHLSDLRTWAVLLTTLLSSAMTGGLLGDGAALHAAGVVLALLTVLSAKGMALPSAT